MSNTIAELLAGKAPDSPAIGAPGRPWLSYGGLAALSDAVRHQLRAAGVGPEDRVAIVLPNGPEMAAAFITIAQSAVTAPLNPAYRQDEFAFYLEDLKARAIVLPAGYEGPAAAAALAGARGFAATGSLGRAAGRRRLAAAGLGALCAAPARACGRAHARRGPGPPAPGPGGADPP